MDLYEKLAILAAAAKYDASCASSGSKRKNEGGLGDASSSRMGVCHSWTADGRCVSLLKVLFSNYCSHDCVYCVNRRSNDLPRATFEIDELVQLTIGFYRRNYIEGLFLSSGVLGTPDQTMERLNQVVKRLRVQEGFNGYIHLKIIPGTSEALLKEAGSYADRLSVNIELPSERGLKLLAPDKKRDHILKPMAFIHEQTTAFAIEKPKISKVPNFAPAGQSTQLIVGATQESDLQILRLTEKLYQRVGLRRVYYSAYVPVVTNPLLPTLTAPPLKRENRLYQADWLLRFYGFDAEEVLDAKQPFLDPELDPKTSWALRNLHLFPIEINRAAKRLLLRVPGIGIKAAERILAARRFGQLDFEVLKKIGVVMKRAKYFITCQGKSLEKSFYEEALREKLLEKIPKNQKNQALQLPLFTSEELGDFSQKGNESQQPLP